MQPYGEAAWRYREAGWSGVLPLPAGAKWPPPSGFTGWAGVDPSNADVRAWIDLGLAAGEPAGNIALRLPHGVYGLDVDAYGAKRGGDALGALIERCGPLPPTWVVTSRDDASSGIRLYAAELPIGRHWRNEPGGHGAGIEAIHFGHRYAVAWPSIHPETGRKYVWRRPDGLVVDGEIPTPATLPELPAAWVEALSELGETRVGNSAGHAETIERVDSWRDGEPCPPVVRASERAMRALREAADGAALHPAIVTATHELVSLGHEGHAGVRRALADTFVPFVDVRAARPGDDRGKAEAEWWRAVRGAVGKLDPTRHLVMCDCEVWSGTGLLFEPDPFPELENYARLPTDAYIETGVEVTFTNDPPDVELDVAGRLIGAMLDPAALRDRPAPAWLIEGLLTLDSASWLIAAPASYKSFVALDWAGHVGAGRPWLGHTVTGGGVVYMVAEGVGGMGPRIRAWEQRNGGPMSPNVRFLPMPVQISKAEQWAAWVEACRRLAPALIILDTQARITVGIDENDNSAMGVVVDSIERLRKATGACVLVVHHLGRGGTHARGASAIDGAQDTELRLTRTADFRATLQIDKSKNAADDLRVEVELFTCELDNGGTSLVVGPPITSAVASVPPWREGLTDNEAAIADILAELYSEHGATRSDVRAALRERGQRGQAKYVKSTFDYAWNQLAKKDIISRISGTQRFELVPAEGTGH